jgi:hypothetical protein
MPDIIQRLKDAYSENPAKAFELLPELFKATNDGKIVVLPYKPGKELFWIDENKKPYEIQTMYLVAMFGGFYLGIKDLSLNKFVFADKTYGTREAAEKALEEQKK